MNNPSREFLNCLPVPVIILDDRLEPLAASRSAYPVFALSTATAERDDGLRVLGERMVADGSFIGRVGAISLQLRTPGSSDSFVWRQGDRTLTVTVAVMAWQGRDGFGVSFQDISESTARSEGHEFTRLFLEGILDSMPSGVAVMDREQRLTHINRAQRDILDRVGGGRPLVDLIGAASADVFAPAGAIGADAIRETVFGAGLRVHRMCTVSTAAGDELVLDLMVAPLLDRDGGAVGAIRVCTDVTEKTRLAADAREAEILAARLATLRQVAITVNHEINNCLTSMILQSQLMLEVDDLPAADVREMIEEMLTQAERIRDFTGRLHQMRELRQVAYIRSDGSEMLDVGV